MPYPKKKHLTLEQKVEIVEKLNNGVVGYQLARQYNVSKNTITKIKKKKQEIINSIAQKRRQEIFDSLKVCPDYRTKKERKKKTLSQNNQQFDQPESSTKVDGNENAVKEIEDESDWEDDIDWDDIGIESSEEDYDDSEMYDAILLRALEKTSWYKKSDNESTEEDERDAESSGYESND